MAFTRSDFTFEDAHKCATEVVDSDEKYNHIKFFTALFRVQKNRMNGQKVRCASNNNHIDMCPVKAAIRLVQRSIRFGLAADEPLGKFKTARGDIKFITAKQMATLLQNTARIVHNLTDKLELSRYMAHSLRFWAATLLSRACCTGNYIQICLRWKSESFLGYLRNTHKVAETHSNLLACLADLKLENYHVPPILKFQLTAKSNSALCL